MLDVSISEICHHQVQYALIHGIDYIPMLSVWTSNVSFYQLQYELVNGLNVYLCQAFRLVIQVIIRCNTH